MKTYKAPSVKALAERTLNQNAIKFGEHLRRDAGAAYPFFYSFVSDPYLNTAQVDSGNPAYLNQPTFSGVGPDGFNVAPASVSDGVLQPGLLDIPIRLDRDLNFDLLEVRYSVRGDYVGSYEGPTSYKGKYYYVEGSNVAEQDGFPRYNAYPYKTGIPVWEYCRVSLYAKSGQDRSLYGGMETLNRQGVKSFEEVPIPITAMQGIDDGKNCIRTPYLLSREAVVVIRVRNYFDMRLSINGYLFGYKVSH
jgi:hypothetical protein